MFRFTPPAPASRGLTLRPLALVRAALLAVTLLLLAREHALAQCDLLDDCGLFGQDTTRTASILVSHAVVDGTNVIPVHPATGETWTITSLHQFESGVTGCGCDTRESSVTADASWTGSTWNVACTGCGGGNPILALDVCGTLACTAGGSYSAIYELIADITTNHVFSCGGGSGVATLIQVDFETTSVDPGDTIRTGNCTLLDPVTPTSQTFSVSDTGPFECGFSCNAASGPNITLTYEY